MAFALQPQGTLSPAIGLEDEEAGTPAEGGQHPVHTSKATKQAHLGRWEGNWLVFWLPE